MEIEELNKLRSGFTRFTDEQKQEIVKLLELTGFIKSKDELIKQYEDVRKEIKSIANGLKIIGEYNNILQNQTKIIEGNIKYEEEVFKNTSKEIYKTSEHIKHSARCCGWIQILMGVIFGICLNSPYAFLRTCYYSTYLWVDFATLIAVGVGIGFFLCKIKSSLKE